MTPNLFNGLLRRAPVAGLFLRTEIAYVDDLTVVERDGIIAALAERKVLASELVGDDKECSVCKESLQADEILKSMPCKHEFHKHCLIRWLREARTCPLCRCNVQGRQLVYRQFSRNMEMQSRRTRHPHPYRISSQNRPSSILPAAIRRGAQLHINRLLVGRVIQSLRNSQGDTNSRSDTDSDGTSEDESSNPSESDSNGHQEPFIVRAQQLVNCFRQSNSRRSQGDTNSRSESDSNGTNPDVSNSISEGDSNRREN
ncbi:E3 ubiquitin-protein ligase RZF1-like [Drosophila subobscura]|uniref:E3 ubiquitin-protein ligase RZF1-like n=1 Tax=Drosophila subobscura TaxID=7241 RepID=UPI00155A2BD3|nr:E3 ubiquitin-protein ligase RZF1-like [Drosophila subobscura]